MKIINWLKEKWENILTVENSERLGKITLNKPTNTKPPEVKLKRNLDKPDMYDWDHAYDKYPRVRGEGQKEDKNKHFERETFSNLSFLDERLKLIREKLKKIEDQQTVIIRMLMDIKDKL